MGAALRRETPGLVLQLLQAGIEPPEPVSGSESPDHHRGVFTLGQHFRRCRLRTGTAKERPGRPPPPHAGAGDTSHPVEYTDLLAGERKPTDAALSRVIGIPVPQALKHCGSFYEKAA